MRCSTPSKRCAGERPTRLIGAVGPEVCAIGLSAGDFRARAPRVTGSNLEHNLDLVERLRTIAAHSNVTALAIAWVGPDPRSGSRRAHRRAHA